MISRYQPISAKDLITRMRHMLGHLGRRDKETVLTAIDAITDLSVRLHEATHVAHHSGGLTITTRPDDAHESVQDAAGVLD